MSDYEITIPGREAAALRLAKRMMSRNLEQAKSSDELQRLFCRCVVAVRDPERTILPGAAAFPIEKPSTGGLERVESGLGAL